MTGPDQPRPTGCTATTTSGAPCNGTPRPNRAWCFSHDPDLADVRAEGRARGGTNRAATVRLTARMPATVADVVDTVLASLVEVRAGRMEPARGQAVASLARAAIAAYDAHDTGRRLDAIDDHLDVVAPIVRLPR